MNELSNTSEEQINGYEWESPEFYGLTEKNIPSSITPKFFMEFPQEFVPPEYRGVHITNLLLNTVNSESNVSLVEYLKQNNCSIALAITDLDEPTAEAIRVLNDHEVPVEAWITIPDSDGYFLNPLNVHETIMKTDQFIFWKRKNGLVVESIGLDLEPPYNFQFKLWKDTSVAEGVNKWKFDPITAKRENIIDICRSWINYQKQCRENIGDMILLSNYAKRLQRNGIKLTIYNSLVRFGSAKIPKFTPDKVVEMRYSNLITNNIFKKTLRNQMTAALGIINGVPSETPGRDFGKGKLPDHLSDIDITNYIISTLSLYNFSNEFANNARPALELYFFALNHPSVAERVVNIINHLPKRTTTGS